MDDAFYRGLMSPQMRERFTRFECIKSANDETEECKTIADQFSANVKYINSYDIYGRCYFKDEGRDYPSTSAMDGKLPPLAPHLACTYHGPLESMLNNEDFKRAFNVAS